jgi:hypothetical protein
MHNWTFFAGSKNPMLPVIRTAHNRGEVNQFSPAKSSIFQRYVSSRLKTGIGIDRGHWPGYGRNKEVIRYKEMH